MHTRTEGGRGSEREGALKKKAFSGFLICIKPVCMSGNIRFYYAPALHAWATRALACVAWFMVRRKAPIDAGCWESVSVNSGSPSKRHGHTLSTELPMRSQGRKSSTLRQTAHIFTLSLLSPLSLSLLFFPCSFSISLGCNNWERLGDVWVAL